jgi:hypothetical protein
MMKRDTNIDELFKTSRVNDMINQQEFLNKINFIGYNLAANKLKVNRQMSFLSAHDFFSLLQGMHILFDHRLMHCSRGSNKIKQT